MFSAESEILNRHTNLLTDKTLLLTGGVQDNFYKQLISTNIQVNLCSAYYDFVQQHKYEFMEFGFLPSTQADLIIYYWVKNKQEALLQLMHLLANSPLEQQFLIVGENRSGVKSVEKMLKPFGNIYKLDNARHCLLYSFTLNNKPKFSLDTWWNSYQNPILNDLTIYSLPGVFSANELDLGTTLLLESFANTQKLTGKVLDLGCGAGVIGSYLKQKYPQIDLVMTDINAMAIASAKRTLVENKLTGEVVASNVFSDIEGKFDLIVSNPPFHNGLKTAYAAVEQLIEQAQWFLRPHGELRIVANSFLPYAEILDANSCTYTIIAKTTKFKVYSIIF